MATAFLINQFKEIASYHSITALAQFLHKPTNNRYCNYAIFFFVLMNNHIITASSTEWVGESLSKLTNLTSSLLYVSADQNFTYFYRAKPLFRLDVY